VQNEVKSIYTTVDVTAGISEETLAQDRQRLFLEGTTADLKSKLNSDLNATKANRMRITNVKEKCFSEFSIDIVFLFRKILFFYKN
jgi:hypothetical protein